MSDQETTETTTFVSKHSFLLLITFSVFVSVVIVVISLAMYNGSGAAQLDLSRPGYKSIRSQALNNDGSFKPFPADGELSGKVISDFGDLYDERTKNIKAADAFGGDPLSPTTLGIAEPNPLK